MMVLCSLFDRKACSFSPAVSYPDTATATRSFVSLLAAGDSTPAQWPDDFCLYSVGLFDSSKGLLVPSSAPECIMTGQQALYMLEDLRQRQARGGAVGGTVGTVPPEDSGASAERNSSVSSDTPDLFPPASPADSVGA